MEETKNIKELIYEIRGKKVMLARDISFLLEVETKKLNQKVKRNIELFSNTRYFQMSEKEFLNWKSQIVTSNNDKIGLRKLPYVFTYEGILVLANYIKSEKAKEVIRLILKIFEEEKEYEIMGKSPELKEESLRNMIYEIDGKQVIFDFDLAKIYGCANGTKDVNKAVKRNIDKFPEDFYFQLTKEQFQNLKFQIGTSSWNDYGGVRKLPFVFTEQGVAMLSSVLNTINASKVSVAIMRAFVLMRKYIASNNYDYRLSNIETKLIDHDIKIEEVFNRLDTKVYNHLFFEGQIYDAYSLLLNILSEAKKEIIIIDNYTDKNILDVLTKIKVKITIITSKINKEDIDKYNKQYNNIKIKIDKTFHDRFIIIDKKILYHSGASFKDLGKKCFAINKIENTEILNNLLLKI